MRGVPPTPPNGPPRRPAELSLQELVREGGRLLDVADQAERRNAARARELEALAAEARLLRESQEQLRRELGGVRPIDLAELEKRLDALGEILVRLGEGLAAGGVGSVSARIAAPRPGAGPAEPEPR